MALRTQAERLRAEEELQRQREALFQSEKLAALGRLAAGVGHELKNPLAVIQGRLKLLEMDVSAGKIPTGDPLPPALAQARQGRGNGCAGSGRGFLPIPSRPSLTRPCFISGSCFPPPASS